MPWPVMPFGFMAPSDELANPAGFWGRQPPSQIDVIIIASGGGSIGGGGGGGGVVILSNLTTDFFPTLGARSPSNKTTFKVYGRNQPTSNGVSNGFDTVFTTYNSDGSTKNEYTAIGGGYGNQSSNTNGNSSPGGFGGSGGGAGGSPPGPNSSLGGAGTGTQGKAGGAGFFGVTNVSPYLYTIYGTGGGGGYSAVGTAGSNSSLTLYGGNGGNGLSLAPYLSSVFQTFFTDGSLAANGYSNYSSIVAASGAGGFTVRSGGFVAGTPGTGAGKSIDGQHTATGFGCGAACTGSLLGEAGGGLAIMSYAGSPYTSVGYRQYDGTRTYHVFFGPPDSINQRGTYYTFTCQM